MHKVLGLFVLVVVSASTGYCHQRSSNDQSPAPITNWQVLVSFVQLMCPIQLSCLQTMISLTLSWTLRLINQ